MSETTMESSELDPVATAAAGASLAFRTCSGWRDTTDDLASLAAELRRIAPESSDSELIVEAARACDQIVAQAKQRYQALLADQDHLLGAVTLLRRNADGGTAVIH